MEKKISKRAGTNCILILVCYLLCLAPKAKAQGLDISLLRDVYHGRPSALDNPVKIVEKTVYPLSAAIPTGLLVYGLVTNDSSSTHQGIQIAGGLVITTGIAFMMKEIVKRERPYYLHSDIIPYEYDNSYSFPSGHTSIAFSTATSLFLQYRKWYVAVPAFAWAGLVGYGRMYQGMHYPTDVAMGALAGAGSSCLSYYGQRWIVKHKRRKKEVVIP